MTSAAPRSLAHRLYVAFALLAALLLAVGLPMRMWSKRAPARMLLVVQVSGAPGDLSSPEGRALATLVKDLFEIRGHRSVNLAPDPPLPGTPLRPGEILLVRAHRDGNRLGLQLNVASTNQQSAPEVLTCPAQEPAEALDWMLQQIGTQRADKDPEGRLIPRDPQAFWALLEGMATATQGGDHEAVLALLDRVESRAPGCASASILRGETYYLQALESPRPTVESIHFAKRGFEEALSRWFYHPRAALGLVRLHSDIGHAKEALDLALAVHRAYPLAGSTCSAVLYASRFAGLMEVVDRASVQMDAIAVDPSRPQRMQLGLLYLGQWSAFERSLWTREDEPYNAVQRFHMAYLRLLQGRKVDAHALFADLEHRAEGYPKFLRLGRVFRLILEGQKELARKDLQGLDDESTGLAVPDGEFTFNLAEAWALLGDQRASVDAANRALGQGFACTRWYQQSPLLRELQTMPRWQALIQVLRQREERLYRRFPAESFD